MFNLRFLLFIFQIWTSCLPRTKGSKCEKHSFQTLNFPKSSMLINTLFYVQCTWYVLVYFFLTEVQVQNNKSGFYKIHQQIHLEEYRML